MTLRRKAADLVTAGLHGTARLLGPRFYRLYLDDLNRRFNDHGNRISVDIGGRRAAFACPNQLTRWRVETLLQKEPSTIAWIDGFAEGETLWDVGANIGIYAVYAAMARNCSVVAIEPVPVNFAILSRNIAINGLSDRVMALPLAFAATRAIAPLHIEDDLPGSAFAKFGGEDGEGAAQSALGISIDQFVDEFSPPFPDHIKIDVDGTEGDIIAGAGRTLADHRLKSLSVELDDAAPENAERVSGALSGAGFDQIGSYRSPMFPDSPAQNVHFVRKSA